METHNQVLDMFIVFSATDSRRHANVAKVSKYGHGKAGSGYCTHNNFPMYSNHSCDGRVMPIMRMSTAIL